MRSSHLKDTRLSWPLSTTSNNEVANTRGMSILRPAVPPDCYRLVARTITQQDTSGQGQPFACIQAPDLLNPALSLEAWRDLLACIWILGRLQSVI